MAKYLIFLVLMMVTSLFLLGCPSNPPELPDFATFYAGWISTIITNMSGQDIEGSYNIIVIDKDKSNVYLVWNISKVTKPNKLFWGHKALGLDGAYYGPYSGIILRDEEVPSEAAIIPTIRKTLISNNITNVQISFLLEVIKGAKRIVLTGFDEGITNLTNISANMYGLGYYDAIFDGQKVLTNVVVIVPMNNSSNSYEGGIVYDLDVTDTELRIKVGVDTLLTNIPF